MYCDRRPPSGRRVAPARPGVFYFTYYHCTVLPPQTPPTPPHCCRSTYKPYGQTLRQQAPLRFHSFFTCTVQHTDRPFVNKLCGFLPALQSTIPTTSSSTSGTSSTSSPAFLQCTAQSRTCRLCTPPTSSGADPATSTSLDPFAQALNDTLRDRARRHARGKKARIKQEPYADGFRPTNAKAPLHGATTIYVAANPAHVRTIIDLTARPRKFFSSDDFDRRVSARATKTAETRRREIYGTADSPTNYGSRSLAEVQRVKAYLLFTERRWEDCGRLPVYDLTNPPRHSDAVGVSGILSTPSGGPRFVFKRARGGPRQEFFKIPSRFSDYKTFTSPLRFKPYDLHPPLRGLNYSDP